MNKYILLILIGTIFVLSQICGLLIYKSEHKKNYSYLNMFPFEMKNDKDGLLTLIFRILVGALVVLLSLDALNLLYFGSTNVFLTKSLGIILSLTSLVLISLFIINFKSFKAHIYASSIFSTLVFISYTLFSYIAIINHFETYSITHVILGILGSTILLFIVFLPSFKSWDKMNYSEDENGNRVYKRNKVNLLSLFEWVSILLFILLYVLITII